MRHDISAVVLDLSATGVGIVRSLKKKGITVYAFDSKEKYTIGKTRHATCGVCPHPVSEERSEEHTSELQSRGHLVCRLLLEKKKIGRARRHHPCSLHVPAT